MLLYSAPFAPNPRRVRIFLAEKALNVPMRDLDLAALEQKSEAFTKLNPLQRVPGLVLDDGAVLTESVAICRFFERLHPEPPLFGSGAREEAFVEMWQRRVEFGLFGPVALAFRHSHPAMAKLERPQLPELAVLQRERAADFMRFIDAELAERPFLAGDAYTIADITAIVAMDMTKYGRVDIPSGLLNLENWRTRVSSRPSAKA
jgi:glutathione S-transferase